MNVTPIYTADSSDILGIHLRVTRAEPNEARRSIAESAVFCVLNGATGAKNSTRGTHFDTQNAFFLRQLINQMLRVSNYVITTLKRLVSYAILMYIWYNKGRSPFSYHKYRQNTIRIQSFYCR